ncbi:MAG: aldehyde dehydrogenase family protein, partial [Halanaerobiales bacterium]
MGLTSQEIKKISEEVMKKYQEQANTGEDTAKTTGVNANGNLGIYSEMETAINEAEKARRALDGISLEKRGKIIKKMREAALENAAYLGKLGQEETGFGRPGDKKQKNILAAEKTPGIEDLSSTTYTGDDGLTLVEQAPYGIIGSITPSTNPSSTIINNSISMIAAGNVVVYNPHPGARKVSLETMKVLNRAIRECGYTEDLLFSVAEPTVETSQELMDHDMVRILVVTGGEAVVNIAMQTGKKVIAAGPGNPPVIVDNTADIAQAARDIVDGASFDNN